MTTVAHCSSVDEAQLIRSLLEGSGIAAFVPDELTAQNAPPYMFVGSGVRVQVEDEQAAAARELLAAPGPVNAPDA